MRFRVLGPVSYRSPNGWQQPSGALRARLLGVLLAHADRPARHDVLTEALWPADTSRQARQRLHVQVHRLRRELGDEDRIAGTGDGYQLVLRPGDLDAQRFETAARLAVSGNGGPLDRSDAARAALQEWPLLEGGTAYDGVTDVPVCRDEADRLTALRLDVAEVAFRVALERGRHLAVLPELTTLARAQPLRESLQALLMRALLQAGRQDEALDVFTRTRRALVTELGIEPSDILRDAQSLILTGGAAGRRGTRAVPAQIPVAVPLVGRDEALAALDDVLLGDDASSRIVVVSGPPGVGKSALVAAWANQHRERFGDGQLFVDLHGFSPTAPLSPRGVLDAFVRALGGTVDDARDIGEQAATYRSLLADRSVLVVLDNARDPEQVRPLLPGAPGCRVLVTSRDALGGLAIREGALRLGLPPLEPEHAIQLLRGGRDGGDDRWHRLARRCDFLPLTLRLAAERVVDDPEALDRLTDHALDGPETLRMWDSGDPATSAREVFSWSLRGLPPGALALFEALGVDPAPQTATQALSALTGQDDLDASRSLDILVRAHLAEVHHGWVRQHDLLAAFAQEQARHRSPEVHEAALTRLTRRYAELVGYAIEAHKNDQPAGAFSGTADATAWLSEALDPVVDVVTAAPTSADEAVVALSARLYLYTDYWGRSAAAIRLHTHALAAAQRLDDTAGCVNALVALASACMNSSDRASARRHLEAAHQLAERTDTPVVLARLYNVDGSFRQVQGDLPGGVAMFERSLEECERAGGGPRYWTVLSNLGYALLHMGRLDEAEHTLTRCVDHAMSADGRPVDLSFPLMNLAWMRLQQDRLDDALDLARQTRVVARRVGNLTVEAESMVVEGLVHLRAGRDRRAAECLEAALPATRDSRDRGHTTLALLGLGRAQRSLDPGAAHDAISEALARARRQGTADLEGYALLAMAALLDTSGGAEVEAARLRADGAAILERCGIERPLVPLGNH